MKIFPGLALRSFAACVALIGLAVMAHQADAANNNKPLFETPVYHAPSKSYFALINMKGGEGTYFRSWAHAASYASRRRFKGTKGHLAVVDSPELHEFLRKTFRPNKPTWIGLRYFCGYGKSQWITGDILSKGDYKIWNKPWNLSGNPTGTCTGSGYMPIYYTSVNGGFRWAAQGPAKNWHYYFVQYPTGEE